MTNPITIRFPYYVRLVESKPVDHYPTDEEWERRWRVGIARREARKIRDMPVPMLLRKHAQ